MGLLLRTSVLPVILCLLIARPGSCRAQEADSILAGPFSSSPLRRSLASISDPAALPGQVRECDPGWDGAAFGVLPGLFVTFFYAAHSGYGETETSVSEGTLMLIGMGTGALFGFTIDSALCRPPPVAPVETPDPDWRRTVADDWPYGGVGAATLAGLSQWILCEGSDGECEFRPEVTIGALAAGFAIGLGLAPED